MIKNLGLLIKLISFIFITIVTIILIFDFMKIIDVKDFLLKYIIVYSILITMLGVGEIIKKLDNKF